MLNRKLWPIAGGLAVAVLLVLHLNQPFFNYAKEKISLNDFSGQVRKIQWAETWEMLKDKRIVSGAGLANYQEAVAPFHKEGFFFNKNNDPEFHRKTVFNEEYRKSVWQPLEIYLYPHNIFLNFWTELGLAGLILFIWIIGKYFKNGLELIAGKISESDYFIAGLSGAMLVVVVHGLVDVPYFKNDLAVMFWIMIAMLGIIHLNAKSSV